MARLHLPRGQAEADNHLRGVRFHPGSGRGSGQLGEAMDAFLAWLGVMAIATVGALLLDIVLSLLIRAGERR